MVATEKLIFVCLLVMASLAAAEKLESPEIEEEVKAVDRQRHRHHGHHREGALPSSRHRSPHGHHAKHGRHHHAKHGSNVDRRAALADFKRAALSDFKRAALADFKPDFKRAALSDFKRASLSDFKRAALADFKRAALSDFKRAALADFKRTPGHGKQHHRQASESRMSHHKTKSQSHHPRDSSGKRSYYWDVCSHWINGQERLYVCKKQIR
uniref:Conserved secreted protein n=1 Tax=Macrostomum lignano TaxID=282301 RepID=A0A1I8G648_9PLAT